MVGATEEELREGLAAVASGRAAPSVFVRYGHRRPHGLPVHRAGRPAGGMGRELHAPFPVFAEAFDTVCALDAGVCVGGGRFGRRRAMAVGIALAAAIGSGERLDETEITQPALFAFEVALYRLAESWGLRAGLPGRGTPSVRSPPRTVAGVFSLEDACTLVKARGALMQALPAGGAMVAVQAAPGLKFRGHVDIAAVNGPQAVVISGPEADVVEAEAARFAAMGRKTKRLTVSHAFHSRLMDPMLAEFRRVVEGLTFQPAPHSDRLG